MPSKQKQPSTFSNVEEQTLVEEEEEEEEQQQQQQEEEQQQQQAAAAAAVTWVEAVHRLVADVDSNQDGDQDGNLQQHSSLLNSVKDSSERIYTTYISGGGGLRPLSHWRTDGIIVQAEIQDWEEGEFYTS